MIFPVERQGAGLQLDMCEVHHQLDANHGAKAAGFAPTFEFSGSKAPSMASLVEWSERVSIRKRQTTNKVDALPAPEAG